MVKSEISNSLSYEGEVSLLVRGANLNQKFKMKNRGTDLLLTLIASALMGNVDYDSVPYYVNAYANDTPVLYNPVPISSRSAVKDESNNTDIPGTCRLTAYLTPDIIHQELAASANTLSLLNKKKNVLATISSNDVASMLELIASQSPSYEAILVWILKVSNA